MLTYTRTDTTLRLNASLPSPASERVSSAALHTCMHMHRGTCMVKMYCLSGMSVLFSEKRVTFPFGNPTEGSILRLQRRHVRVRRAWTLARVSSLSPVCTQQPTKVATRNRFLTRTGAVERALPRRLLIRRASGGVASSAMSSSIVVGSSWTGEILTDRVGKLDNLGPCVDGEIDGTLFVNGTKFLTPTTQYLAYNRSSQTSLSLTGRKNIS